MPSARNIKVIGIGAGGSNLVHFLGQHANYWPEQPIITLVDGDSFESKNHQNQRFRELGNKAEQKKTELRAEFSNVRFRSVSQYVSADNVAELIEEDDVVFLAVDNYVTMAIVNAHCRTLDNVLLISGGVDERHDSEGDVCIYLRRGGKDVTPDLTYKHPEIAKPVDKAPYELSCEEVMPSRPARLVSVIAVVSWMLATFANYLDGTIDYYELYFDTASGKVRKLAIPDNF